MSTPEPAPESATPQNASAIHWPSLAVAVFIMVAGSVYPILFADAQGRADHRLATLLFWAMSAGLVRGVGFVPRWWLWRGLFSGWAVLLALAAAALQRWAH